MTWYPVSLRAGCKSDLSLEASNPEHFKNETGFSMQLLTDLQTLVACFGIAYHEKASLPVTNLMRIQFREITTRAEFSSRVTLAMRQSQGWQHLS